MNAYYSDDNVQLFHGDFREVLPSLGLAKSTTWVFADPPYGESMPYTGFNDSMSDMEYASMVLSWAYHMNLHARHVTLMPPMKLWKRQAWHTAMNLAQGRPFNESAFEEIVLPLSLPGPFQRGFAAQYRMLLTTIRPGNHLKRNVPDSWPDLVGKGYFDGEARENTHPGKTPLALVMKAIQELHKPEWMIVDPFCGSGTTLMAAKKLGLKAIGCEISLRDVEFYSQRLSQGVIDYE